MVNKKIIMLFLAFLIPVLALNLLSGCAGRQSGQPDTGGITMAGMDAMPDNVKSAPVTVQQAYRFAVANPDTLKQIPCYCGCGAMGHTSNYSCYITDVDSQGKIAYDDHALGCSICVDITQDVMRLLKEKKTIQEIRAYVDSTYSKYGPSNISSSLAPVSLNAGKPEQVICTVNNISVCASK